MLRGRVLKFLLAVFLLCGCAGTKNSAAGKTSAQEMAESICEALSMTDEMEETKLRIVKGMIFDGEEVFADGCLLSASEEGNSNVIGVFFAEDPELCYEYLAEWLADRKLELQAAYPAEVFKISNAVVQVDEEKVIVIVCEDISKASQYVKKLVKN